LKLIYEQNKNTEMRLVCNASADTLQEMLPATSIVTQYELEGMFTEADFTFKNTPEFRALGVAMEDHFRNLSLGVASLINIFAPQKVIIGGGISESGDFYIDNIREQVGKYVMKETSYFTTIELARLGNKAGCLGAAALVFNH